MLELVNNSYTVSNSKQVSLKFRFKQVDCGLHISAKEMWGHINPVYTFTGNLWHIDCAFDSFANVYSHLTIFGFLSAYIPKYRLMQIIQFWVQINVSPYIINPYNQGKQCNSSRNFLQRQMFCFLFLNHNKIYLPVHKPS